jgi:hypothetical protein
LLQLAILKKERKYIRIKENIKNKPAKGRRTKTILVRR